MLIPGIDLNEIVDGMTLGAQWEYYTVNVKYLQTMTHEDFCRERPNAAKAIERASRILDKLNDLVEQA